jgi:hypothetical protein
MKPILSDNKPLLNNLDVVGRGIQIAIQER